jgi:hypothetical protein
MTSVVPLGRFERVSVRDAWPTEDGNFTPWLAQPESIKLLGEALNVELEVEAVEHWVGPFRADILARDINESDHRVLIENQFGRTDHTHLGQLLTYLAGIENVKTIVWIAEVIQADHRAAVDWLNVNTVEEFSFFVIEMELWRIGDSPAAPRFNVVASPNDWARTARSAARRVGEEALAERHHVRLAYWASFSEYLRARGLSSAVRRPNKDNWLSFGIGRANFSVIATISTEKRRIGVELYSHADPGKAVFRALLADREIIDREFGEELDWQELPAKKTWRIVAYKQGVDPADETQRQELHAWMADRIERFRTVFSRRVRDLTVSSSPSAEEEDESLAAI